MKPILPVLLLLALACATNTAPPVAAPAPSAVVSAPAPSKEIAASSLQDPIGLSAEAAVEVPKDAPNHGIDFENNWIFDRYGKFRRNSRAIGQQGGRRYEVITVELWKDHSQKTIYFDITENWNSWTPEMH
jgi:hypothetical protein